MVVQRYVSYIAHLVCLAVNVFLNIFFLCLDDHCMLQMLT